MVNNIQNNDVDKGWGGTCEETQKNG